MTAQSPAAQQASLRREAQVLARYLVGRRCRDEHAARYAEACVRLGLDKHDAVATAALGSRWLLGPLDAATALRQRDGVLRGKLVVMTAILETTTVYTRHFMAPRGGRRLALVAGVAWHGARAVAMAAVGLPLLWWRARR